MGKWKKLLVSESGKSELRILRKKYNIPDDILEEVKEEINNLNLDYQPSLGLINGVERFSPRRIGFYSDAINKYTFSMSSPARSLPEGMKKLLNWINTLIKEMDYKMEYNGILVNHYPNGNSSISRHSDNEIEAAPELGVMALSFGVERKFRIRDKETNKIIYDYLTEDQRLIWMAGDFQKEFTHEIPKEPNINRERYSLTFRYHC